MGSSFLIALQFLTRLPVPAPKEIRNRDLGRSLLFYPLVGLIIGLLLALLNLAIGGAPSGLAAAVILAAWVVVSGALHLDGLADSADAWLGGLGNREKTLATMKDPACGPAAVVLIVLVLIVKFAALTTLVTQNNWLALVLIPLLARTALPLLFLTTPYVRSNGLGTVLAAHYPRNASIMLVAVTAILTLFVSGSLGLRLILAVSVVFLMLRVMMLNRIGGTTGDTAGALVELCETAALISAGIV